MARMRKSKKSDDAKAKSKQAEDRRKAYASMASAGISSLAGDTTDDARGRDARERQREYPDWRTQLNKIYDDGIDKWKTEMVDPVKAKWPKDNSGPK